MSLMNTYARLPVSFVSGQGCWLTDDKGEQYLDAISGIGVCCLGHADSDVSQAIEEQSKRLIHTSNLYQIPAQEKLAKQLCDISGLSACFFGNSGAEANEAAIKIARLYGHNKGIDTPSIIVMDGAFHGRTLATLTATANRKVQAGFEPLVQGFVRAPFNDIEAIKNIAKNNHNVVAILIEPIQGEGGLHTLDDDFLSQLREVCDEHDWLLMLDEIQTGNCRTGKYFAYQHSDILPDVITTAKGLGNGFPIGVCIAGNNAAKVLGPGNHGTTYGGNPLACFVASTVSNKLRDKNLAQAAHDRGEQLRKLFKEKTANLSCIKEIRGKGLMVGIELNQACGELVKIALANKLLINVTANNVIRLLPPLVISDSEIETLADRLVASLNTFLAAA